MRTLADKFSSAKQSFGTLLGGRSTWGLADQLLVSFTNFATMILVAKGLDDQAAFGAFTLVYSALLFANILQFALITQPHNVLGATRHGEDYRLYTTATAIVQLALAMLLGAIAGIVAIAAHQTHFSADGQLIALVPSIIAWQLQEFVRRVLYTEGRMRDAFTNDVISYGGQTVIVAVMFAQHHISGARALWALAITSGAAAGFGFFQIRTSLHRGINRQAIIDNWHFGKWLLGSELLQWCSSLQMYLYLAAFILGTAASGTLRAAQILFGPARVFSFLLQSLLPIRFSRALASEGEASLTGHMRKAFVLVLLLMGPYCLILALFPKLILSLIFKPSYAEHPMVLSLYSIQSMLGYSMLVITAALSAMRRTRDIFLGSLCSALTTVALAWPFIRVMGIAGVIACMMSSLAVMITFLVSRFLRTRNTAPTVKPLAPASKEAACAA
jgi:O-antigen/teichoic acid export membrane protein